MEEKKKKRRIAIFLSINPDETDDPSGATEIDDNRKFPGSDETYQVFVNGSDNQHLGTENPNPMLDAACHEFGHILSGIFRLPGGMSQDPRSLCEFKDSCCVGCEATKEQARRIYSNEKLAWELARKMNRIGPNAADTALNSYQKLIEVAETDEQREMRADHKQEIANEQKHTEEAVRRFIDELLKHGLSDKEEEKPQPVAA